MAHRKTRGRVERARAIAAVALCLLSGVLAGAGDAAVSAPCPRETERVELGTWTTTPIPDVTGAAGTWRMDVDERDPRLVLVADYEGVLVTRDGGCSWTRSLTFDEFAPRVPLRAADAEVVLAPSGARSLYVLVLATGTNSHARLLSSKDDGRTWTGTDLPPEGALPSSAAPGLHLVAGDAAPSRLYLLTHHTTGTGSFLSSEDEGATWRWRGFTTTVAPPGVCAPGGVCSTPPLRDVDVDPRAEETVWALAGESVGSNTQLLRSEDAGASWEDLPTPAVMNGATLLDAAPGPRGATTLLLLGWRGAFALSRDGGGSWEAGEFPQAASGPYVSAASFDVAHTSGGRTFASLLGSRDGAWAGNVMLLRGHEWTNVSPKAYSGYDRKDEEGRRLTFAELKGAGSSYVMLSSAGRLATFRPDR